jgi:hypothetical protein
MRHGLRLSEAIGFTTLDYLEGGALRRHGTETGARRARPSKMAVALPNPEFGNHWPSLQSARDALALQSEDQNPLNLRDPRWKRISKKSACQ